MLLPLIWAGDFSLGDKALVIYLLLYISSVCGSVIMISVHHTTVTWLLLVGARILFVTVCASWRNTVEVDLDGSSLLVLYWLCRLYCCSTLIEVCGCRVLTVTQQNKLKIKKIKKIKKICGHYVCVSSGEVSRLLWICTGVRPVFWIVLAVAAVRMI
jgi:hypothetical protein